MLMSLADFKALVASIADDRDAQVDLPEGFSVPLVKDVYEAPNGGRFQTVVGYVTPAAVEVLDYVAQDYAQLFLPDGSVDMAKFEDDGRLKQDATAIAIDLTPVDLGITPVVEEVP